MKKVLLIGYPFPLRQGGSPRLLGLAKFLPEFGWQPVILTAPLDQKPEPRYRVIETGYRQNLGLFIRLFRFKPDVDIRRQVKQRIGDATRSSILDRLLTLAGEIVNYPDSEKGWKSFAVKDGSKLLSEEKFDAIISSSAPITAHIIATRLKSRFHLPWIADLRDLWTQNHNYSYSRFRKWLDRKMELQTLASADALVTVSPEWAEKLGQLHKNSRVFTIVNGFDPDTLNYPPVPLTEKLTITYTGLIYPGKQDPTRLLEVVAALIAEKDIEPQKIEIRFYGEIENWLDKEIERLGLSGIVTQYGSVSRDVAIQRQRESQILLLLNWDDSGEKGTIPGKVFEYLAALRPIIAIGGSADDAIQQILFNTNSGCHATTVTDIKEWLRDCYSEYIRSGTVTVKIKESVASRYSQREMAKKFSGVLGNLS